MVKTKLKNWEIAALTALCVFFLSGLWAGSAQQELAGGLVRLHVIANSDADADQAQKLQVRDRVLALLSPLLAECRSRDEAVDIILKHRAELEAFGDVALGTEYYPTRDYGGFSLPAGEYVSLRIVLGEGAGRNWWCVVFPPLCTEALAEPDYDAFAALEPGARELIDHSGGYTLRFRVVEWWSALAERLG